MSLNLNSTQIKYMNEWTTFLRSKGLNDIAIAGFLGGAVYPESNIRPDNLQNSYENKWEITEEEYANQVDRGTWKSPNGDTFETDRAGWGYTQLTSPGRKSGFLNYVKSKNKSIKDSLSQMEWMWIEINSNGYANIRKALIAGTDIEKIARLCITEFERPQNQTEENQLKRVGYAKEFYETYFRKDGGYKMGLELHKCILTNNDCYKEARKMTPKGIVVHSTASNNPYIKRYVQPDDGILGKNKYNNDWNRPGVSKCVHAFIGLDKNDKIKVYQTLPWGYRPWGCASGKNGSYNNSHIQFEICEDDLKNAAYFLVAMDTAAELCAYLCKEYNLSVKDIVSHHEAYIKGYASNHGDIDHWLKIYGKDMNWFRECVAVKLKADNKPVTPTPAPSPAPTPAPAPTPIPDVKIDYAKSYDKSLAGIYTCTSNLNIRSGAGVTKTKILCLPKNHKVTMNGYYTSVLGTKWFLVAFEYNGKKYTGFCSSAYLKK